MSDDESTNQQDNGENSNPEQDNSTTADSTPNEEVEAPQSDWNKKNLEDD